MPRSRAPSRASNKAIGWSGTAFGGLQQITLIGLMAVLAYLATALVSAQQGAME